MNTLSFDSAVSKGFNHNFYSKYYADIRRVYGDMASRETLLKHYFDYGISDGRIPCENALKENLVGMISKSGLALEIGPFTNPLISGKNVRYFDVLEKKDLEDRARKLGRSVSQSVEIDFVEAQGDLSIIDTNFVSVLSSHCIEHQPDLVSHLNKIGAILKSDGAYYVVCPDKRYCRDHFVPETNLIDVLVANREKRTTHSQQKVVEHQTLTTHNDPARHWVGDHYSPHYHRGGKASIEIRFQEFEDANGAYIDVHAWQFTPLSFVNLLNELYNFGYTNVFVDTIFPTPRNRLEFIAVIKLGEK